MKILGFVLLFLGIAFYVLVYHSTTQTDLTCTGKWLYGIDGWQGKDETVYVVLQEYRPWIFWIESAGFLTALSKDSGLVRST